MAYDYYPAISLAIAVLPLNKRGKGARSAVYNREREALADQLRTVDPPFSETDVEHERLALEDAIGKVEAEAIAREWRERRFEFWSCCSFPLFLLAPCFIGRHFTGRQHFRPGLIG
jgi:hypothetical protein